MTENDIDTDKPASEQLDLDVGMVADASVESVRALASDLERAESIGFESWDDESLAALVAALKRVESAAKDARKNHAEPALDERVDVGKSLGPVQRVSGSNSWVADDEAALAAVAEAGVDPLEVAKVGVGDLREVLGREADEHIQQSDYTYYQKQ